MKLTRGLASLAMAALAAALALPLAGCSTHLAGTNDAALEYRVDPDPATGRAVGAPLAAAGVKARLSAAQSIADVEATESGAVRVVIDADAAGAVDSLVRWRGGLDAYLVDDRVALDPPDPTGLERARASRADGTEERWWQGTSEAVARAVRDAKLDADHLAFAERLPGGLWRTRVVATPPAVTLGLGEAELLSIDGALHGRALALTFAAGATAPLSAARPARPGGRVAFVRGHTLLCTTSIDEALATPLQLPFGDDIASYTRAYHARLLLGSPLLPPMHRTSAAALPPRWGLAAACALLPCVLSLAWLVFVRRFDRARPEPIWLVLATFGLGALSVVPAGLAEYAFAATTPWLDPSLVTMGGQLRALPLSVAVATVVVGFSEEGAKLLSVWALAWRRREFDEPVDGLVYSSAAALGFAALENVKYFAFGRMSGAVIALRGFVTVPAHMLFSALWGYALGQTLVSRRSRVFELSLAAALAHGLFDALLSTDGLQLAATALVLGLAVAYVTMLQRSLRHGAVPRTERDDDAAPPTEPVPPSLLHRVSFRVGSALAFYGCAAGMVAGAFALTVLGTAYEILHHRVGPVFVGGATTLLALFGAAAYGASETLPLDAVVDARGVTFAGARTAWRALRGVELVVRGRRAFVVVRSTEGETRIGPATEGHAQAIVAAVRGGVRDPGMP
jgi:RsiW-degrading membrane proteinase PrsW (M82 family)